MRLIANYIFVLVWFVISATANAQMRWSVNVQMWIDQNYPGVSTWNEAASALCNAEVFSDGHSLQLDYSLSTVTPLDQDSQRSMQGATAVCIDPLGGTLPEYNSIFGYELASERTYSMSLDTVNFLYMLSDCNCAADPVLLGNGASVQSENDYQSNALLPMKFTRYYQSNVYVSSSMGENWRHSYSSYIQLHYLPSQYYSPTRPKSASYSTKSDACSEGWNDLKGSIADLGAFISAANVDTENGVKASNSVPSNMMTSLSGVAGSQTHAVYSNNGCKIYYGVRKIGDIAVEHDTAFYDLANYTPPPIQDKILLYRPDGSIIRFYPDWGINQFVSSREYGMSIKAIDSQANQWELTTKDNKTETYVKTQYGFVLNKISDLDGKTITLNYDTSGNLSSVSDNFGNSLTFQYTNNLLSLMTTPLGNISYTYDSNKRLIGVLYPDNTLKQYLYEDPNHPNALTGVIDQNNKRFTTWQFDADGRVTLNEHANGVDRVSFDYPSDLITTTTLTSGATQTYHYGYDTGKKRVIEVDNNGCTECAGSHLLYNYDVTTGNLLSKTVDGIITTYGNYDIKNNPGDVTEGAGTTIERKTSYHYDSRFGSKVTYKTEPSVCVGSTKNTAYTYDDFSNLTSVAIYGFTPSCSGLAARTIMMQYNGPFHQLSQIDGPRTDVNDITTFEYYPDDALQGNNRARLHRVTLGNGTVVRDYIQYTQTGKVQSETQPNGISLTYMYYPGNDRLQTTTISDGNTSRTIRLSYLPTSEVDTVILGDGTPNAKTITFNYDDARRLTRITDGLGNYIEYTLDVEGNHTAENVYDSTGALHRALSQTFDIYNHINKTTQANENRVDNFAADGTLSSHVDGKLSTTNYNYGSLKRLTTMTQDVGGGDISTADALTKYGYDIHDQLTSVTDPNNGQTTYVYDDFGDLLSRSSPDTGTSSFQYDTAGNVISRTDAQGITSALHYDVLNRLVNVDYPGVYEDVTYTYDNSSNCTNGINHLCQVINGSETTIFNYNGYGEITGRTSAIGGVLYTQFYERDQYGHIVSLTYPSQRVATFSYDAVNNVTSISALVGGQQTSILTGVAFNPELLLTSETYGNGLAETRDYDLGTRVAHLNYLLPGFQYSTTVAMDDDVTTADGNPITINVIANDSYATCKEL